MSDIHRRACIKYMRYLRQIQETNWLFKYFGVLSRRKLLFVFTRNFQMVDDHSQLILNTIYSFIQLLHTFRQKLLVSRDSFRFVLKIENTRKNTKTEYCLRLHTGS